MLVFTSFFWFLVAFFDEIFRAVDGDLLPRHFGGRVYEIQGALVAPVNEEEF